MEQQDIFKKCSYYKDYTHIIGPLFNNDFPALQQMCEDKDWSKQAVFEDKISISPQLHYTFKESDFCTFVVRNRNVPMLKFVLNLGYNLDVEHFVIAVNLKDFEMLQFLIETAPRNLLTEKVFTEVVHGWHNPQRKNVNRIIKSYGGGEFAWQKLYLYESEKGVMELVKMLVDKGCEMGCNVTSAAVLVNNFELLKYLRSIGCPWDQNCLKTAAGYGNIEILTYTHKQGLQLTKEVMIWIFTLNLKSIDELREQCSQDTDQTNFFSGLQSKLLSCLRYLHENGCPWDETVSYYAARAGNVSFLRYLHENGCPWDSRTTTDASMYGNFSCLRYAVDHGCELNESVIMEYGSDMSNDILNFWFEKCTITQTFLNKFLNKPVFPRLAKKINFDQPGWRKLCDPTLNFDKFPRLCDKVKQKITELSEIRTDVQTTLIEKGYNSDLISFVILTFI